MYTAVVTPPQQVLAGFKTLSTSTLFTPARLRCGGSTAGDTVSYRHFRGLNLAGIPPSMTTSHSAVTALIASRNAAGSIVGNIAETVASRGLIARGGAGTAAVAGTVVSAPLGAVPLSAMLLATACMSTALEQRTRAGAVIGAPLVSFGIFCLLSNLGLAPSTHAVYDLCWSFLLPLSLAIIILGNPVSAERDRKLSDPARIGACDTIANKHTSGSMGPMKKVGVAFLVGAAGSIAGVLTAFRVATSFEGVGGALMLPRETAAQIAGAVTATYIGGSVNLFAVAAAVGLVGATSAEGASLLGALAASDVFLMALYFSGLVAANKTPSLRRLFPAEEPSVGRGSRESAAYPCSLSTGKQREGPVDEPQAKGGRQRFKTKVATAVAIMGLGSAICLAGNAAARRSPMPGTSTTAVTLLSMAMTRILARRAPSFQSGLSRDGPTLATVLLNVFFGSVGAAGRWNQVVGVAPAIFAFSSLALVVHAVAVAVGAAALNKLFGTGLGINDIIVASNANIGGPSTAATFAGLIGEDELIVPAAVWGTVGYAIATTIGVGLWAALR